MANVDLPLRPELTTEALERLLQQHYGRDHEVSRRGKKVLVKGGFFKGVLVRVKHKDGARTRVTVVAAAPSLGAIVVLVIAVLVFIPAVFIYSAVLNSKSRPLLDDVLRFILEATQSGRALPGAPRPAVEAEASPSAPPLEAAPLTPPAPALQAQPGSFAPPAPPPPRSAPPPPPPVAAAASLSAPPSPRQPAAALHAPAGSFPPPAPPPVARAGQRQPPVPPPQRPPAPQVQSASGAPAGWHPDPSGKARLRWWDGRGWTAHTSG